MKLTEQHIINKDKEIDELCFNSKNIYNSCLYIIRQHFFQTNKYIGFNDLYNKIKEEECYTSLPIKVSQLVLKQVHNDFVSFFNGIKEYKVNPSKFKSIPKIPKYKDKIKGRNILTYNNQAFSKRSLKKGIIHPSQTNLYIKTKQKDIVCIRIIPHSTHLTVEVIYNKQEENLNLNKENIIGIDLGVNNLVSITSNKRGFTPLLVKGRILKSVNQFYNKTKSYLQSKLPLKQYSSNNIERLTLKRNNKIKHYMHHVSKYIVNLCKENNIGMIVIGKNDGWKQECNIGRRNNQNFVSIPFNVLINQIKYKAELVGIEVILIEESYTSKCSFLDLEELKHHDKYIGKRIKRGLFRSQNKKYINADVNGSYNIMRKVFPNLFKKNGIEGFVVNPILYKLCRV